MSGRELVVKVADLAVGGGDDVLVTVGLGSCVAILLHDPTARVGGLAHVLLPSRALTRNADRPAKFPQAAVPNLVERMVAQGADPRRITARLAGGASMFAALTPPGTIQMGERNLVATRQVLQAHQIPLVGESVGGDFGRTVRLHCGTGRIEVSTVAHGTSEL
ncbi:MAG TPA: chemotaxis protein CheD [Gemmatimonadales bacterium]|nr:chemotaxis protein CheD [Gemmatimonadales bacterium]